MRQRNQGRNRVDAEPCDGAGDGEQSRGKEGRCPAKVQGDPGCEGCGEGSADLRSHIHDRGGDAGVGTGDVGGDGPVGTLGDLEGACSGGKCDGREGCAGNA